MKLLDDIATEQRQKLENKIEVQKPRLVPESKQKSYKYMIWKEDITENENMILLHLVRRNNRAFFQVVSIKNDKNKCWFLRENLPIAMTPNEDIKQIVKNILPASEYIIKACTIKTYKKHLSFIHESITKYFDDFQK